MADRVISSDELLDVMKQNETERKDNKKIEKRNMYYVEGCDVHFVSCEHVIRHVMYRPVKDGWVIEEGEFEDWIIKDDLSTGYLYDSEHSIRGVLYVNLFPTKDEAINYVIDKLLKRICKDAQKIIEIIIKDTGN